MSIERKYFHINEGMARAAKNANSFSDYAEGSATAEYRAYVDRVYDVVDKIAEEKPNLLERATGKAERYSRKLAEYYNDYYRNEASCPSVLISGGSNFPVRKKEKQNQANDANMREWQEIQGILSRIRGVGTVNGAAPIYVVDGVITDDITFLSPNDIASTEILKDASATAIYGSRGANGVIIVTTKTGRTNQKASITLDAYVGVQQRWKNST